MYLSTEEKRKATAAKLLLIASELDSLIFMYKTFMNASTLTKARDAVAFIRNLGAEIGQC